MNIPKRKEYVDITTDEERKAGFTIMHKEYDPYGGDVLVDQETLAVKLVIGNKQYGCWAVGSPRQFKEGLKKACHDALTWDVLVPKLHD